MNNNEDFIKVFKTKNFEETMDSWLRMWKKNKNIVEIKQIIPLGFFKKEILVVFTWIESNAEVDK